MLVLSRKPGQTILIGDKIKITFVRGEKNGVRLGIDAPRDVEIMRGELVACAAEIAETAEALGATLQHEGPLESDGGPPGVPELGGTESASSDDDEPRSSASNLRRLGIQPKG